MFVCFQSQINNINYFIDGCEILLEINIGLANLIVEVIDDNGLTIFICLDVVGVINRIEFEVNKRITRGVISCVV